MRQISQSIGCVFADVLVSTQQYICSIFKSASPHFTTMWNMTYEIWHFTFADNHLLKISLQNFEHRILTCNEYFYSEVLLHYLCKTSSSSSSLPPLSLKLILLLPTTHTQKKSALEASFFLSKQNIRFPSNCPGSTESKMQCEECCRLFAEI